MITEGGDISARSDWLRQVEQSLAGRSYEDALTTLTYDDVRVEPIYERAAGAIPLGRAASGWMARQVHAGSDADAVHSAILEDLAQGAGSVELRLAAPGLSGLPPRFDSIAQALAGVPLDRVQVSVSAGDQYFGATQCLMSLWEQTGLSEAQRLGAINADPLGTLARTGALEAGLWPSLEILGQFVASNIGSWPNVRLVLADGRPYHEAGASEGQELAAMLATVVEYLRVLSHEGVGSTDLFPRLSVALAADCNLFASLAKLRAARLLLARVAEACGAPEAASEVTLEAATSERMLTRKAPYNNVLRATIASIGSVLGGADTVTILPFTWAIGATPRAARRIARNTHNLLREESHLGRVLDPAAGSGAVESLTRALAERAWSLFQDIEEEGGMAEALKSGMVAEGIARVAERRAKDVAEGKLQIVGVTAFADAAEKPLSLQSHPASAPIERAETRIAALPRIRAAERYEGGESQA